MTQIIDTLPVEGREPEPLSPFAVDPQIAFGFAQVATVKESVINGEKSQTVGAEETFEGWRQWRRDTSGIRIMESCRDVSNALAQLVLRHPEPEQITREFLELEVRDRLPRVIREDSFIDSIVETSQATASHVRFVTGQAHDLAADIMPMIYGDEERSGYELLKLFIAFDAEKSNVTGVNAKVPEVFPFLTTIGMAELEGNLVSPAAVLVRRLSAGDYDSFIAEDIFRKQGDTSSYANITQLLSLMSTVVEGVFSERDMQARLVQALPLWPQGAKKELDRSRELLLARAGAEVRISQEYARVMGYTVPEGDIDMLLTKQVDQLCEAFRYSVSKQVGSVATRPMPKLRSRGKSPVLAAETVDDKAEMPEPATVVVLKADGTECRADSAEYDSFLNEFVSSHQGAPHLKANIDECISWLSRVDLSKGIVKGLKKYNGLADIGQRKLEVYGFKPSDAVGLPLNSKVARQMRILFVYMEERLGIIAVAERSEVKKVEKRLGLLG